MNERDEYAKGIMRRVSDRTPPMSCLEDRIGVLFAEVLTELYEAHRTIADLRERLSRFEADGR